MAGSKSRLRFQPKKEDLLHCIIMELMLIKLNMQFSMSPFKHQAIGDWTAQRQQWHHGGVRDFFLLSVKSIQHMDALVAAENHAIAMANIVGPSEPASSASVKIEDC